MDQYETDRIRNIALVSHSGTGKTSLAEALYFITSNASRLGCVEEHNTVTDYDPDEHERGMSINLSSVACEWSGTKVNVIDTPGYADFVGEVISGLHGADAAAVLIDATAGIEVGTDIVWRIATDLERPRILVVSRMDRENVDSTSVTEQLRDRFGSNVAPIQFPLGDGPQFRGVVDLLDGTARIFTDRESSVEPVPDKFADAVEAAREQLLDAVAATDDSLLEQYLEGQDLTRADMERALRSGVADGSIYPVIFTSATELQGVREALTAFATLLPSPSKTLAMDDNEPAGDEPVVAQVFKTLADPFVGKVSLFRLFAGRLDGDAQLVNQRTGETERLSNIQFAIGKDGVPAPRMAAGDIGFVTKLDGVATGDTLTATKQGLSMPAFLP